ncbi:low temperature-induced protein [Oculatella sp. LEGE 06141]|uniref:low temperature-induced protein n=1 Tax=Oculatella sp. LEGE 06141 TaxID=1828648 RepID=UPI001882CF1F|nr:low temperature-induced protein [Oculatella sp. LEGE 06141]MBE9179938.1 low temperature-induced protein [Oculatella sp. LEGE 06141]
MRLTRLNLSKIRPVRVMLAFVAGIMMLFSYAAPAYSDGFRDPVINSSPSNPTQGEAQLDRIFEKSEEALQQSPPSLEKEQAEQSNGGLNVDQGTADIDKMYSPEDTQHAKSAEQSTERGLRKLLDR